MFSDAISVFLIFFGSVAALVLPYLAARRSVPLAEDLPYVWGAYCGFAELLNAVASLVQVVVFAIEAVTGKPFQSAFLQGLFGHIEGRPELLFTVVGGMLAIPAGVGLLGRRRYGVWALFAVFLTALSRMLWLGPGSLSPRMILPFAFLAGIVIASWIYFSKRWARLR